MRDSLVSRFQQTVLPDHSAHASVAVVGGSLADPEAKAVANLARSFKVLGIEGSDVFFDLNLSQTVTSKFDLVLCSQVLEHVWRPEKAIANLASLLGEGGMLWLNCPASNFPHGSPSYFSAGYTDTLLTLHLETQGLKVVAAGQVCSRRNYVARHLFNLWLSEEETRCPLRYIKSESLWESINRTLRFGPKLLFISFLREEKNPTWAVESWAVAKRLG